MERPVKIWYGSPERTSICRMTPEMAEAYAHITFKSSRTKKYVRSALEKALVAYTEECVSANAREFASYAGISFADLGVLLRYQEMLIYNCAKWK